MEKNKIVIIDDHNIFRNSLKVYLESTGDYTIAYCAENGKEGIQYIENNEVDLVILDIEMPVLDGIKTLRYLKENFPKLLVLVLSFYKSEQLQHKILLEGAAGVLCKSVDLKELDEAIQLILKDGMYISREVGKVMIESQKYQLKELSKKELMMVDLLIKEYKIEDIALLLNITKRSAENLRLKIKEKVGVKTSYGLVQYAIANGFKHFIS